MQCGYFNFAPSIAHNKGFEMDLDIATVRRIAKLARLRPDSAQQESLLQEMAQILEFFDQLAQADTDAVAPLAHPLELDQRLREDAVTEPDRRADYQKLAPDANEGLYRVPPVLDSD